ncbi:MAG: ISL3 family transposase [Vulcanibacillus sp.]
MLLSNYTEDLLELEDVIVNKVENINNEKHIYIKMKKRPHICPSCGIESSNVHDYRYQIVKDIPILNKFTYIHLQKRRYVCPYCDKRFYESNNFLPKYHRFTNRLYAFMVSEFHSTHSMKSISTRCNTSQTTVARIFDNINHSLTSLPEVLSIDEFKGNAGGEKFQCILTNPKAKKVLDILPNRKSEDLYHYFSNFKDRNNVKYFVTDMNKTYRDLAITCFKNATIIADKYHVVRQVTWAFENVRKEEQKKFNTGRRKYFKRSRTLLLKRFDNLTEEQRIQVENMLSLSERMRNAYMLKERFYDFMKSPDVYEAKKRLSEWHLLVGVSNLPEFNSCFETFVRWQPFILNAFTCPYTNGYTEGVNNKIKVLKRNSYGVKNFKRFRNRILYMMSA